MFFFSWARKNLLEDARLRSHEAVATEFPMTRARLSFGKETPERSRELTSVGAARGHRRNRLRELRRRVQRRGARVREPRLFCARLRLAVQVLHDLHLVPQ